MSSYTLTPFQEVLDAYRRGKMIVLVDNEDRENEGDLVIATEAVTPEAVSFMMNEGRGLICISLSSDEAARLNLPLQTLNNNSAFNTPFAVSVDHVSVASEGVTARARAATMRSLIDPTFSARDFVSPGHVFPLIANPAGVIGRQGQTEGSYDLSRAAGLRPSGVICEILGPDGSVRRGESLREFVAEHSLPITSVAEIIKYRVQNEILVRAVACSVLNTDYGPFETHVFEDDVDDKEHLALVRGSVSGDAPVLVRIHSECLTGDLFGSERCDCGQQLGNAMSRVAREGGVVLYLQQEGRGIGLANKVKAYALQDQGHDTVEANVKLGFAADQRDFAVAAKMITSLGIKNVKLLTNNPDKVKTLEDFGVKIVERIPLVVAPTEESKGYLDTKRDKMGHWL